MTSWGKSLFWSLPAMLLGIAPAAAETINPARAWDRLWEHVLIDLVIIGGVFGLGALYMMIKYRAKGPDDVGRPPKLTKAQALAWVLLPTAVFMADDFYLAANGWSLFSLYRGVPADAMEIKVTGYQWYWEFDYGDGVKTDSMKIPVGKPVVLRMVGADVIHSFALADFRVKEDVMPGRVTYLWFQADEAGHHMVTCTMYCGLNHAHMYANVDAVPASEFHAWLETQHKQAQAAASRTKG